MKRYTKANGCLLQNGLYDPKFESDSCGVGFVAKLDGLPSHNIINSAIKVLINLEHRGALGGDKSTGDGAGIMIDIPDSFFRENLQNDSIKLPDLGDYGVGMIFLPSNEKHKENCIKYIEEFVFDEGCDILGWRKVPVNNSCIGELAKSTEPTIYQVFVHRGQIKRENFERKLYVIRRQIEKTIDAEKSDMSQFYIASFSSNRIVYKGLLTANQLNNYYLDLSDSRFKSKFGIVHQRYSTNTQPTWNLAQPFRFLAHNGEINTLNGNINRMKWREFHLKSDLFGDDIEKIKPIIIETGSDSAIFDNVLELLVLEGRSIPHAMMMMVPEAYGPKIHMSEDKRAFYDFHSAIMEPWDGPAAIIFTDSRYLGAILDRNGLRPTRYTVTKDGIIVLASESGVLEFTPENIIKKSRLSPGKMLLVDFNQNRVVPDKEIKAKISRQKPYRRWIKDNIITLRGLFTPSNAQEEDEETLLRKQLIFGYTEEELKLIISPMASRGQEPIGSMGNDTPLAVLSEKPNLLFYYFKQRFAQVTNPPIDPLREELVMSLESFVGGESNLLEESPENFKGFKLLHPIITPEDLNKIVTANHPDITVVWIDILFNKKDGENALENAMESIFAKATNSIQSGITIFIPSDYNTDENMIPIPSLLACSGLHQYLSKKGLRTRTSIIIHSGEVREIMHYALLVSYGADAICPYLVLSTIYNMAKNNLLEENLKPEEYIDSYIVAVKKGLLKTMSRLGISTFHSYFASQNFEAIGLSNELVEKYFSGTISRLDGIDIEDIQKEAIKRHNKGYSNKNNLEHFLPSGGEYSLRVDGEKHFWNPISISLLQLSTRTDDYEIFKEFTNFVNNDERSPLAIRKILDFRKRNSIPINEVEPIDNILKRFVISAMSFGSISKEAHETIAIAANRLGLRSNSGEGGEDIERNRNNSRSKVKQIASGRFGVTPEYILSADELQIKIAQGAKPGEGGQLPGHKVTSDIARVRHTTEGVTLISPPPYHDIYSIEDLAQLIYDLKCINQKAKISVKLVSESGVGTIASGVAKAQADIVVISGYEGGTGASQLTSIKHTGIPWEIGLAETHQTLIHNGLREKIKIQVDGQLKTGRDLAIATLLGAEEYGFATSILVTLGCVLLKKCHQNTCSTGIATQDPVLRAKFSGKPEYIERFLKFLAQELREIMAYLGFKTINEMVGRTDILEFKPPINLWKSQKLNLSPILNSGIENTNKYHIPNIQKNMEVYDDQFLNQLKPAIEFASPIEINLPIKNTHRTVGARLSGYIINKYGYNHLPEDTIKINFYGSAGQSFGAFLTKGITFKIEGDANDYLGKGLAGGKIIIVPERNAGFSPQDNVICGNVTLYGATSGEVFINGKAGERFAVRNSGATAVVEGVGDHACEYMTGGVVVCIGSTGKNFAAGMSGGIAYIFDETQMFDTKCNLDMVDLESVWDKKDISFLHSLIEKHFLLTSSSKAKAILDRWESSLPLFVKVIPLEYKKVLERIKQSEHRDIEIVSATEEVYNG